MIYTITLNPALDKTAQIDSFTVGSVNRISTMRTDPGGKGINVSKVIASLEGQSCALGILGGRIGSIIKTSLDCQNIKTDFIFVEDETRVNLKIIDSVAGTNTDINEPGNSVSQDVLDQVLKKLLEHITPGDIVVFAGSVPNGAPKDIYRVWIESCKKKGAKTIVDADGELLYEAIKSKPYLIKPNIFELERIMCRRFISTHEIAEAGKQLVKDGIEKVVISLGENGALFITKDKAIHGFGLEVKVISTVGAGDSMVASLALSEEAELPLEQAVKNAIATSAANVMCSGTQAAGMQEILNLIEKVEYILI